MSLWLTFQPELSSCPIFIHGGQLAGSPIKRNNLYLYSFDSKRNQWHQKPIQVDPMSSSGRLIFFNNNSWINEEIGVFDRISFYEADLGDKATFKNLPCSLQRLYEVKFSDTQFGYLASCVSAKKNNFLPYVSYDSKRKQLKSKFYIYTYNSDNHMLFDLIEQRSLQPKSVAERSEILINADFKRFFRVIFNSDDIESKLEEFRIGPVGAVASVSFYLKIMFFKIRLALTTDVNFFSDSAYIPMIMFSPGDAHRYLTPKSGILYSWRFLSNAETFEVAMPKFHKKIKDISNSEINALNYCNSDDCLFRLSKESGFQMIFKLSKDLIKKNFFPIYLDDLELFSKHLQISEHDLKERSGIFFNVSELEKGEHRWDFWLQFSKKKGQICPQEISIIPII